MGLVAWGETHIDSSVAGIAQSTVPIFTFILAARFLPHERVGPLRIAGVALGFLGVAALTGLDTAGGWWVIAGTLAVVLSSLSYASGGVYGQLQVRDIPGPVLATGTCSPQRSCSLPLAIVDPPREVPGTTALAGLVGLILIPTFAGQLLLFRVLRLHGSRKLSIVTYLMPAFAVVYGARPARRAGDGRDARRVRAHRRGGRARLRPALLRRARAGVGQRERSRSAERRRTTSTSSSSS